MLCHTCTVHHYSEEEIMLDTYFTLLPFWELKLLSGFQI